MVRPVREYSCALYGIVPEHVSSPDDTVGDLKKLVAAQVGTKADKIVLKKW